MLYDNDLAVVESLGGRLQMSDPDMVARHARWLDSSPSRGNRGGRSGRDMPTDRSRVEKLTAEPIVARLNRYTATGANASFVHGERKGSRQPEDAAATWDQRKAEQAA